MEAMDTVPTRGQSGPTHLVAGSNLRVFKVTPGPIGAVHSTQLNGELRLEMTVTKAITAIVTMLLLSEEPANLQIDQLNKVLN